MSADHYAGLAVRRLGQAVNAVLRMDWIAAGVNWRFAKIEARTAWERWRNGR